MLQDLALRAYVSAVSLPTEADPTAPAAAAHADFWGTPLGGALGGIMTAVAILIVLFAVFSAVKNVLAGKVGKAVGVVMGALAIAAILWKPELIETLIGTAGDLFDKSAATTNDLIGNGGTPAAR